jgi:dolichyl-phosphate-mannose-protein mannosyltransferase
VSHDKPIQPRIEAFLNERPGATLLSISAVYFLLTLSLASIKLLWLDELITFHIAKLGSMTAIWKALSAGADPNPPLTHILSLWSMRVFGDGTIAFRLPAILAGWISVVCLFLFLRRRVPGLFAAAGVCIFMATAAFDYSYEERSYALVLAFSSASLLAWQRALETKRSILFPALMAIALAASLSANYFAVLAFFPIFAGQLVYDVQARAVQWRIWIAMLLGALPFFVYLPLIDHAIAKYTPYAWNKVQFRAVIESYVQMVESMLWVGLALLAAALIAWLRARRKGRPMTSVLPRHEAVAVFVLMAYPFLAYIIARVRGGMLSPRFVLPVATGFAIASSVAAFRLFQRRPAARLAFLTVLVVCVFVREGVVGYRYYAQRLAFYRVIERLPAADHIVVSDSLLVLPLQQYAPREISSRIVFPIDFAAIRRYKKEDSPEQNLFAGGKAVFPVALVSLDQVKGQLSHSLIVSTRDNWLVAAMRDQGMKLRELPIATESEDITGFTPLCHGPVVYFSSPRTASHISARQEAMPTKPLPDGRPHAKP